MIKKFLEFVNEGKLNESIENDLPKIVAAFKKKNMFLSYQIEKVIFHEKYNEVKFIGDFASSSPERFEKVENNFNKDVEKKLAKELEDFEYAFSIDDSDNMIDLVRSGWKEFKFKGKLNESIENDLPKIKISFTSIINSYSIIKILFKAF